MIKELVNHGADVDTGTFRAMQSERGDELALGYRVLHAALTGGHVVAYRALLEAGADPNAADRNGHNSVMMVCNRDELSAFQRDLALRELLDAMGDPSLADVYGRTAMHRAACREDGAGLMDALWSSSPSTLSKPDLKGDVPLSLAAQHDRPGSITMLLSLGATPLIEFGQAPDGSRTTPLVEAVVAGHVDCVRALLDAGLKANGGPKHLTYAMYCGLLHRSGRTLQRLLDVGGDEEKKLWANVPYANGPNLHVASLFARVAALSVLLGAGADETAVDANGKDAVAGTRHEGGLGIRVFRPKNRTSSCGTLAGDKRAVASGFGAESSVPPPSVPQHELFNVFDDDRLTADLHNTS
eukprot:g11665.t1